MGSYTKINGHFTFDQKVEEDTLQQVEAELSIDGFLKERSAYLKTAKMQKAFKDRYFGVATEWKNTDPDSLFELVKELVVTFTRRRIQVKNASLECAHEYGELWKIGIAENTITLFVGEIVYKPTKTAKFEVVEEITKTYSSRFI